MICTVKVKHIVRILHTKHRVIPFFQITFYCPGNDFIIFRVINLNHNVFLPSDEQIFSFHLMAFSHFWESARWFPFFLRREYAPQNSSSLSFEGEIPQILIAFFRVIYSILHFSFCYIIILTLEQYKARCMG